MDAFFEAVAARLQPAAAAAPPSPIPVDGQRAAAVLAPLCVKDGCLHLLYFLRTEEVPTHKGQICFPGGRHAPEDATMLATALRETEEEIGVPADRVRVLGYLGHQKTMTRQTAIEAFVGVIPYPFAFRPDPREVAEILVVPVERLRDPKLQWVKDMEWRGVSYPMRHYDIHSTPLWGATAYLTELLLEQIAPLLGPPPAAGGRRARDSADAEGGDR